MLLRVEFSFFFGDSYSKKSSDANLSCELCLDNFCHVFFFFQYFGHLKINYTMSFTIAR